MNTNRAANKAFRLLAHPLSLAAMALLLLNDHLLRQLWPSWLTGKLGDFAWLFFFPFALALLLAWLVPARLPRQAQITGGLAFGLTGAVFSLAKSLPAFNAAIVQAATRLFGFEVGWRYDPSDLLALSALAAGWLLWQRTPAPTSPRPARVGWQPALPLLVLSMLLTVANAAQPETGVSNICAVEQTLLVCSSYTCYESQDGGMSWVESQDENYQTCQWENMEFETQKELADPADPAIRYRYTPGEQIERSTDGGQTWQVEYTLRPVKQAERAYSFKISGGNADVFTPPLDALADPASGNILFAMGFEGVLVRQADGTYTPVAVGKFTPAKPAFGQLLLSVLSGEMLLALVFGGLGIATLGLPPKRHWVRMTALVLGWLAWAATSIAFPPAIQEGAYSSIFPNAGTLVAGIFAFILGAETLMRSGLSSGKLALRLGLLLVLSALVYMLPLVLWLLNLLPEYYLALGLGVVLAGLLLVWHFRLKIRDF